MFQQRLRASPALASRESSCEPTSSAANFVIDTRYHLEVLLAGGVWEREYDRDVWDLRRFARAPENTARYLRFTEIPQQWIRDLAKRRARRMISKNSGSGTIAGNVRYLGEFAQFAARQPNGCQAPEQLTRHTVEAWLAWMQAEGVHVATRKHKISGISVFLDTIHTLGWEQRLPRTTVVIPGDGPKPCLRGPGSSARWSCASARTIRTSPSFPTGTANSCCAS
jgi:hypothetical protein